MKILAILLTVAVFAFADDKSLKGANQYHNPCTFDAKFPLLFIITVDNFLFLSYLFLLHCIAPLFNVDTPTAVEGEYIVVFKQDMQDEDRKRLLIKSSINFNNNY